MESVKSLKIDGEDIHVFKSAIYIFESRTGFTLELDMIISEVVIKKYKMEETLIVEIELEDGRIISSIMHVKVMSGRLPQLNVYMELEDPDEYPDFLRVNESDSLFPNIEEGLTIEEIRKVEMPDEKVTLKLKLPVDQVEWLQKQRAGDLNAIFQELIYEYWGKRK